MQIVLIPGWNETTPTMRVFADGRHKLPGLRAFGFQCAIFDGGSGSLHDRIDQLAEFTAGLRAASDAPIGLVGYSAGGLIARGLVRAHAARVPVAAIVQVGAPKAGIVTDDLAGALHRIHFSSSEIEDLDFASTFMRWLNGTGGRWTRDAAGEAIWKLDRRPWVCGNVPIINIAGRMPRYHNRSDGVVLEESASLCGHLLHGFIDDARANHLNLSGATNLLTLVLRRWGVDDCIWPIVVGGAAEFFRQHRERFGCDESVAS